MLPVRKIIIHPSYSRYGPGDGYDIVVLHVYDTKLKVDGVVREGYRDTYTLHVSLQKKIW